MMKLSVKKFVYSFFATILFANSASAELIDFDRCLGFDDIFGKRAVSDCDGLGRCACEPTWSFTKTTVAMTRTDPSSQVLATGVGGVTAINAEQLGFDYKLGYNLSLRRQAQNRYVEIDFLAIDSFVDQQRFAVPGGAGNFLFSPNIAFAAAEVGTTYSSKLYSGEVNFGHITSNDSELFVGYRMISIDEQFSIIRTVGAPVFEVGSSTENQLHGLQFGARRLVGLTNRLSVGGTGKAGVYWNHASSYAFVSQPPGTLLSSAADREDLASASLEASLNSRYRITEKMTFLAGYQMLYLSGVAFAPDQFPRSSTLGGTNTTTTDGSSTIYHGGFVGIEFSH